MLKDILKVYITFLCLSKLFLRRVMRKPPSAVQASCPVRRQVVSKAYELVLWPDCIRFQIYDIGNTNISMPNLGTPYRLGKYAPFRQSEQWSQDSIT